MHLRLIPWIHCGRMTECQHCGHVLDPRVLRHMPEHQGDSDPMAIVCPECKGVVRTIYPLAPKDDGIYSASVRPREFVKVHESDWQGYESVAHGKGIELGVGSVPPQQSHPVWVNRRNPDGSRSGGGLSYGGVVRCGRPRWEHALRQLLELDDPCFPAGDP